MVNKEYLEKLREKRIQDLMAMGLSKEDAIAAIDGSAVKKRKREDVVLPSIGHEEVQKLLNEADKCMVDFGVVPNRHLKAGDETHEG